jgi:hypothetical protein
MNCSPVLISGNAWPRIGWTWPRYADTHGFNNDSMRSMWRWRDWVVEAFNQNMPYDRFITDQLAGGLGEIPHIEPGDRDRIQTAITASIPKAALLTRNIVSPM